MPVQIVDGSADRLPAAVRSFDAAVVCLVLCTVPDPAAALAKMFRVLRPGGQVRFLEHVQDAAPARRLQRVATLRPRLNGGCHTGRDTATAIKYAGFVATRLDWLTAADAGMPFPAAPQILGTAVRPAHPRTASTR